MNFGLCTLVFLDRQLAHLASAIEGQTRAPTGIGGARPGIADQRFTRCTGRGCGRLQKPSEHSETARQRDGKNMNSYQYLEHDNDVPPLAGELSLGQPGALSAPSSASRRLKPRMGSPVDVPKGCHHPSKIKLLGSPRATRGQSLPSPQIVN